ncbi:MAG TPA: NAD(P)H-dependent oxidoreductase [Devosiaceae bacterium]|jgi:putative NADPH-quinone reductase|nr:NAD(P)H-dependent oxidoreductase [Devosiaceae bacterium]
MRVLVVHAHPVETSFSRSLYSAALETLSSNGHEVDALNLYDEGFEAVMSREERLLYHEVPENLTPAIKPYVDRLRAAEAIVFIHPVWNYGYPAILKGFFDRVFVPGVSFVIEEGKLRPILRNIRKAVFITSYGGDRFRTMIMGDPPRRLARRWAWATFGTPTPPTYLALYKMDRRSEAELAGFVDKVKRTLAKL